jgi:hypothetical protein
MQRTETKAKHCSITSLFYLDRSGMDEMNKFLSMRMTGTEMKACKDKASEKYCKRHEKQCDNEKIKHACEKTCSLCPKTNPSSLLSLGLSGRSGDKSKLPAQGIFG